MAMLLITHDMGVIAGHADRVQVMYAGRMVETAETGDAVPAHASPVHAGPAGVHPAAEFQDSRQRLLSIGGLPPDLAHPPAGCRFAPRCGRATDQCRADEPPLSGETVEHQFACWHPVDGPASAAAGPRGAAAAAGGGGGGTAGHAPAGGAGSGQGVPGHGGRDPAAPGGQRARGVQRLVHRVGRGDVRAGRRVGLRQDHARAGGGGPGAAGLGRRAAGRPEHLRPQRRRAAQAAP